MFPIYYYSVRLQNEMATRFAVADPVIKALCKVTGCRIHLERSVLSSEEEQKVLRDYVCLMMKYQEKVSLMVLYTL